jgi:hypothetical protein
LRSFYYRTLAMSAAFRWLCISANSSDSRQYATMPAYWEQIADALERSDLSPLTSISLGNHITT